MSDEKELLGDFVLGDINIIDYRKSYSSIRMAIYIAYVVCYMVYIAIIIVRYRFSTFPTVPYLIGEFLGAALGVVMTISFFSSVLSLIIAIFVNRKYTYFERFKKFFWIISLSVFALLILSFSIMLFTFTGGGKHF